MSLYYKGCLAFLCRLRRTLTIRQNRTEDVMSVMSEN